MKTTNEWCSWEQTKAHTGNGIGLKQLLINTAALFSFARKPGSRGPPSRSTMTLASDCSVQIKKEETEQTESMP